jgi:type II secretory pathway component PulM
MFKSVFSRMLAAFTVILLLCITLLVFVVASGLFQESQEKELSELRVAANEIASSWKKCSASPRFPRP